MHVRTPPRGDRPAPAPEAECLVAVTLGCVSLFGVCSWGRPLRPARLARQHTHVHAHARMRKEQETLSTHARWGSHVVQRLYADIAHRRGHVPRDACSHQTCHSSASHQAPCLLSRQARAHPWLHHQHCHAARPDSLGCRRSFAEIRRGPAVTEAGTTVYGSRRLAPLLWRRRGNRRWQGRSSR